MSELKVRGTAVKWAQKKVKELDSRNVRPK